MDNRTIIIKMLRKLEQEMDVVVSQGAGYYTCVPFVKRFNKLLDQSRALFPADGGLIDTFEALTPTDPKDPGDKGKVLLEIHIEINQLITLLDAMGEERAT